MNPLRSSSHFLLGLPINLLVLILLSRSGCQSNILLVHLSFGRSVLLFVIRHFSLLCVSIQQGIFAFFMYSFASLILLLMYCVHSSSFSVVSISSSLSSWKDTSLSWSLLELWPVLSSVSWSVAHFFSSSSCFFVSSSVSSAASFWFFWFVFSLCLYDET